MDVTSIYNSYFDNTVNNAGNKELEGVAKKDMSKASDEELLDVCKKFESYFVEQVMKEMIKTVPETEGSNKQLVDFFKDMTIQELATEVSDKSNLGLAQMMYEQMKRNYNLD